MGAYRITYYGTMPCIAFKADDGQWVQENDVILNDDGTHKVYGIVRFGRYGMPTEIEATHHGFYVQWIDDGANEWSKWWRQDILFWLSERTTTVLGNSLDNPSLLELINGKDD